MIGSSKLFLTAPGSRDVSQRDAFAGTVRLTAPPCPQRPAAPNPGAEVYAGHAAAAAVWYDCPHDRAVYLWGVVAHPRGLRGAALLREMARMADEDPRALRDVLGHFVLIIDDRRARTVSFVTDVLGVRPMYVGAFDGRLVAGSDVLAISAAGLSHGEVDYDALGSWLQYGFDCTGGSVLRDYRRLPGGTISTFAYSGERRGESVYAPLRFSRRIVPADQLADALHECVSRTANRLLDGVGEVNLPLSGGYDSRYVAALASQRDEGLRVHLTTAQSTPAEARAAEMVADALRLPLRHLYVPRHLLDLHDDPFTFSGDGFPGGRNITHAIAALHRGMPVLSGYMGDVLMRAPLRAGLQEFLAQDDRDVSDAQLVESAHSRCRQRGNRLDLLRTPIARRSRERALAAMGRVVQIGRDAGAPMNYVNLCLRHRIYFAGIFLGHIDVAEALLPFYSWELIDLHTSHRGSFRADHYRLLMRRRFPQLAEIPHNSELMLPGSGADGRGSRASRHLRAFSAQLLQELIRPTRHETAILPRKLLWRLPAGLLAEPTQQDEVIFLYKISLFEQRLRRANVRLDWSAI